MNEKVNVGMVFSKMHDARFPLWVRCYYNIYDYMEDVKAQIKGLFPRERHDWVDEKMSKFAQEFQNEFSAKGQTRIVCKPDKIESVFGLQHCGIFLMFVSAEYSGSKLPN